MLDEVRDEIRSKFAIIMTSVTIALVGEFPKPPKNESSYFLRGNYHG